MPHNYDISYAYIHNTYSTSLFWHIYIQQTWPVYI